VTLQRIGETGISAEIDLPAGVTGTFEWAGRTMPLRSGPQTIRL
jgi:hypothetical protein